MLLADALSKTRSFAHKAIASDLSFKAALSVASVLVGLWASSAFSQMVLPGSFEVGATGSASYSIPLSVVPGASGVEPKLALVYDSQSSNGTAGIGWGLSGLSTITRCPRNIAQDGAVGSINFDDKDRFCLDGQRLNVVDGTAYGAVTATYWTEREEFSKIFSFLGSAGNPDWFRVRTKSGMFMEFGRAGNSRIAAAGAGTQPTRLWALNKIMDYRNNYMNFSYIQDAATGEYYPDRIDYTGSSWENIAPFASVRFFYEDRTDTAPVYQSGRPLQMTKRLSFIRMYLHSTAAGQAEDKLVREYRLAYSYGAFTGRSRVTSVKQCVSSDANAACLPATTFTWSDRTKSFPAQVSWGTAFTQDDGWNNESKNPRHLVDVDGDGKSDALGFANGGVYVSRSNGASIPGYTRWTSEYGSDSWNESGSHVFRTLSDVNGDGKPDIIGFGEKPDGVLVSLANAAGTGYTSAVAWNQTFARQNGTTNSWDDAAKADLTKVTQEYESDGGENGNGCGCYKTVTSYRNDTDKVTPRFMADVNGDGRADIVGFGANDTWVSLSTGTTFGTKTKWSSFFGYRDYSTTADTDDIPKRFLADMNGDGMADVVEFGEDGVWVATSTGTAFGTREKWSYSTNFASYWNDKTRLFTMADVNGDGLPDVIANTSTRLAVAINTGKILKPAVKWSDEFALEGAAAENPSTYKFNWNDLNKYPIQFVDINGDGREDVVGFGGNGVYIGLSTGSSFVMKGTAAAGRWTADYGYNSASQGYQDENIGPRRFADMNGDGIIDIVGFAYGLKVSAPTGMPADMMLSINNGAGRQTQVTYKPLSGVGAPYTRDAATAYPNLSLQGPMYVVTDEKSSDGIGGLASTTYRYVGAKGKADGRGMQGFRQIVERDADAQLEQITTYLQEFPFTGMVSNIERRYAPTGGTAIVLGQTTNTYQAVPLNAGKSTYVKLTKSVEQSWDLSPSGLQRYLMPTVTTDYVHDDWGNVLDMTVTTVDATGSKTYIKYTHNEYLPAEVPSWKLGRLYRATVISKIPGN